MTNDDPQQPTKNLANSEPEPVDSTVSYTADERSYAGRGNWRETFRLAFDRARRQQRQRRSRRELGQDKTKALIVLIAVAVALVLLFFGVFSHPNRPLHLPGENPRGQANLGRKSTGRQAGEGPDAVAPMLSADLHANESLGQGQVTADDVDRTARTGHSPKGAPSRPGTTELSNYALGRVDFSDPFPGKNSAPPVMAGPPTPRTSEATDFKKPSLVFVRANETNMALKPAVPELQASRLALPVGSRLLARFEAPVSTAVRTPVLAVIEYNYERDGEIVIPAGAKVVGKLAQASPAGEMTMEFNGVEMPDGTGLKLDAVAMGLDYKPLRGYVSGKKTGRKFLVRSLTGLGTIASYIVGPQASSSAGLISTNTLLRERLSDNVAMAGQQQLNELAFSQNLVVTIPGNTRFYVVVEKPVSKPETAPSLTPSNSGINVGLPTLEELRQLMQLRREINDLYTQTPAPLTTEAHQPQ